MSMEEMVATDFIIPAVTAGGGASLTYAYGILKLKRDAELKFDVNLQKERLDPYKSLWKILHELKDIENNGGQVSYKNIEDFLKHIRNWYHNEPDYGGMWLSRKAMKKGYQMVKEEAKNVCKNKEAQYRTKLNEGNSIQKEDSGKGSDDKVEGIDKDKLRAEKFSKDELKKLYDSLTKFRTLLTEDLGTRRNPIVKEGNDDLQK